MSTPRVSIGLPVYNGERYLTDALSCLRGQAFEDFELIISDNASTDRTAEICRAFAATDGRIHYRRNDKNVGAARNYNVTVEQARGEYFKWAAHDDLCGRDFLKLCVERLDRDPSVVLCHTNSGALDEHGNVTGELRSEQAFDDEKVWRRFYQVMSRKHGCVVVFGLMRTDILRLTPMHGDWVGADRNLLAELALHGKLAVEEGLQFLRRDHPGASISQRDEGERLAWFNPELEGRKNYVTWRRMREYLKSISRVTMSAGVRAQCLAQVMRWTVMGRHHEGDLIAGKLAGEGIRFVLRR